MARIFGDFGFRMKGLPFPDIYRTGRFTLALHTDPSTVSTYVGSCMTMLWLLISSRTTLSFQRACQVAVVRFLPMQ